MSSDEVTATIRTIFAQFAPEADLGALDPDAMRLSIANLLCIRDFGLCCRAGSERHDGARRAEHSGTRRVVES